MSTHFITFCWVAFLLYALIVFWQRWLLTCMQHARRLTCVQHTKHYSCTSNLPNSPSLSLFYLQYPYPLQDDQEFHCTVLVYLVCHQYTMSHLGHPIVPTHCRISMVRHLCTLGHANPTCLSYTIVQCRTGGISMVSHLCTLGHANPTCPSYTIVQCRTGRISMVSHLCTLVHANPTCPSYTIVQCRTDSQDFCIIIHKYSIDCIECSIYFIMVIAIQ